jgi:hypothetical protein
MSGIKTKRRLRDDRPASDRSPISIYADGPENGLGKRGCARLNTSNGLHVRVS